MSLKRLSTFIFQLVFIFSQSIHSFNFLNLVISVIRVFPKQFKLFDLKNLVLPAPPQFREL